MSRTEFEIVLFTGLDGRDRADDLTCLPTGRRHILVHGRYGSEEGYGTLSMTDFYQTPAVIDHNLH